MPCLRLVHSCITIYFQLFHDCCGLVQYSFAIFIQHIKYLLMTCLLLVHFNTTSSLQLLKNFFIIFSQLIHGLFSTFPWLVHYFITIGSQHVMNNLWMTAPVCFRGPTPSPGGNIRSSNLKETSWLAKGRKECRNSSVEEYYDLNISNKNL